MQPIFRNTLATNIAMKIIEPAAILEPTFRVDKTGFERCRREQQAMLDGDILRLSRARLFQIGAEFHDSKHPRSST